MNRNSESLIIGVAWNREGKSKNGAYVYRGVALTGKRTEDPFEVILREKATMKEQPLHAVHVLIVDNFSKKTEKHPDYRVKVILPDDSSKFIGVGWDKEGKNGPFTSFAFAGNIEKDDYEVILREKASKSELALFDTPVIMVTNAKKKSDKSPDFLIKAFYTVEPQNQAV